MARGLCVPRRALGWLAVAALIGLTAALLLPHVRGWFAGVPPEAGVDTRPAGFYTLTQRCIDGAAAGNVALASDCAVLLQARDALRGTAALGWSAGAPMSGWTGITLGGTPRRVTGLELAGRGLGGSSRPAWAGSVLWRSSTWGPTR